LIQGDRSNLERGKSVKRCRVGLNIGANLRLSQIERKSRLLGGSRLRRWGECRLIQSNRSNLERGGPIEEYREGLEIAADLRLGQIECESRLIGGFGLGKNESCLESCCKCHSTGIGGVGGY
jgi:hypothetical protein